MPISTTKSNMEYDMSCKITFGDRNIVCEGSNDNWMTLIDKKDKEIVSVIVT